MYASGLFWVSFGLLWVIVAVQGVVLMRLRRGGLPSAVPGLVTIRAVPRGQELAALVPENLSLSFSSQDGLGTAPLGVVLLATASCGICRTAAIEAYTFGRSSPLAATLVVVQGAASEFDDFVETTSAPADACLHDETGVFAKLLGIPFVPTAVVTRHGVIIDAVALSAASQLTRYLSSQVKGAHFRPDAAPAR